MDNDTEVFKLLSLPSVALGQIIKGVTSKDLFALVQCSSKTMRTLQFFERSNKIFKMGVDFQRFFVEVRHVRTYYAKARDDDEKYEESKTFDGEEVPITDEEERDHFKTYWPEDQMLHATKQLAQHFINTLGIGTLEQIFIAEDDPAMEILDWADQHKLVMDNFNLVAAQPENTLALAERVFSNEFMEKVKVNFTSFIELPEDFKPTRWTTDKVVCSGKFQIHFAHWFTIDHLMSMYVESLLLYRCKLTAEDINKFLTAWRDGTQTAIAYVSLHLTEKVKLEDILKGLVDPATICKSVMMRESASFARPFDGKVIRLELEDEYKNFQATVD